jgi:hypothetical protein
VGERENCFKQTQYVGDREMFLTNTIRERGNVVNFLWNKSFREGEREIVEKLVNIFNSSQFKGTAHCRL